MPRGPVAPPGPSLLSIVLDGNRPYEAPTTPDSERSEPIQRLPYRLGRWFSRHLGPAKDGIGGAGTSVGEPDVSILWLNLVELPIDDIGKAASQRSEARHLGIGRDWQQQRGPEEQARGAVRTVHRKGGERAIRGRGG